MFWLILVFVKGMKAFKLALAPSLMEQNGGEIQRKENVLNRETAGAQSFTAGPTSCAPVVPSPIHVAQTASE